MIRLSRIVRETINRELGIDYSVKKRVFVDSPCRATTLTLLVLSVGCERLVILRYHGDGSYCFLAGYANMREALEEVRLQVAKYI